MLNPEPQPLTLTLLRHIRAMGYRVAIVFDGKAWLCTAVKSRCEIHSSRAEDDYRAAVELAQLVGVDVEDG